MSRIYKMTYKQNPNKSHQLLIFMLSQRIISLLVFEILQTLGEVIKLPRIKRESQIKSSLVHLEYRLPFLTIIIYL